MESYHCLRDKWRRRLEDSTAGHNFDLEKLALGKFLVAYVDGGQSMACYSEVRVVGIFEEARDFLSYIRFAELPRILDFITGTNRDFPDVADAYLLDLEADLRNKVDWLLGLIDRALKTDMIPASELSAIRDKFNEAFDSTNPSVRILAMGSLAEILRSDDMQEAFEEGIEDEVDEGEKPVALLKKLLDAGEFNENDAEHLDLAKGFLERSMSF